MDNYKEPYLYLFNNITDLIRDMEAMQKEAEAKFMNQSHIEKLDRK